MEWNRLKTFYFVGKCQSFNKASETLGIAQSALSRSISLLEHQLKTTLFVRHTTGVTLTKTGEALYEVAQSIFKEIEKVENEILEEQRFPKGELRISATHGIVNFYLAPFIPEFLNLYPEVNLRILAIDAFPDFDLGHADIALCPPAPNRKDLIQKPLLTNHVVLYASPEYLNKHGLPKEPKDLDEHQLIGIGDFLPEFANMNWHLSLGLEEGHSRDPYLTISPPQVRLLMAEQGLGITAISREHPGLDKMNLVQVLPHIQGPVVETYIIYPTHLKTSKRVQAFEDFIVNQFNKFYGSKKI